MESIPPLTLILIGTALLLAGKKLFWFFTGVVGFILGVQFLGPLWTNNEHSWLPILAGGLIGGALGALLAIFAQGLAIFLAGFFVGGKILTFLAQTLIPLSSNSHLVFFVIGGIAGAAFLLMFFSETLIVMTSLWGSSLITTQFSLKPSLSLLIFSLLTIIGIITQAIVYQRLKT